MALVVQKYGGTSVADVECIRLAAERIKRAHESGDKVVVVVSARAGVTNSLIKRARALSADPKKRELDCLLTIGEQESVYLMAIALDAVGVSAVCRSGAQVEIITDTRHNKARVVEIRGGDIEAQLDAGNVVVVAGFQGVSYEGEVTTLGRGGSDLTAVALGVALKADRCEIFTDVDGVYTTDPNIDQHAAKIEVLTYHEMLEMASLGANVMQARAVSYAEKYELPFEVKSTFRDVPGTKVSAGDGATMEDVIIRNIALDRSQCRITVAELPDRSGILARIFGLLRDAWVDVDMVVHSGKDGLMSFIVSEEDVDKAMKLIGGQLVEWEVDAEVSQCKLAILSVIGVGVRSSAEVKERLFETLAGAGVNIEFVTTSEMRISCGVAMDVAEQALTVTHQAFRLHEPNVVMSGV